MKLNAISGKSVTRLLIDDALSLQFVNGKDLFEIKFETDFSVLRPDKKKEIINPENTESLTAVLFLLRMKVKELVIANDSDLFLEFEDGTQLNSSAHKKFEAWSITGLTKEPIVCMPRV